jgi:hypothetical protein
MVVPGAHMPIPSGKNGVGTVHLPLVQRAVEQVFTGVRKERVGFRE